MIQKIKKTTFLSSWIEFFRAANIKSTLNKLNLKNSNLSFFAGRIILKVVVHCARFLIFTFTGSFF